MSATAVPSELVFGVRTPLVALGDARYARVRGSTAKLLVAAGLEAGAGMLMATTGGQSSTRAAGGTIFIGGIIHATQAYYQLDLAQRRHAAFLATLAEVEGNRAAMMALARDARLSVEREARSHAFGSGIYTAVVALGATSLLAAAGDPDTAEAGVALTIVGGVGLVHHVARWRASVRASTDLDTLTAEVPTVVPEVGYR